MRSFVLILSTAFAAAALLPGCTKTDKEDAKPAEGGKVEQTHNKGDRGGKQFHLQEGGEDNHDYLCEYVFKDGRLAIYIIDHNDQSKTLKAEEAEITITGIKYDSMDLPPITLKAMEKEGEHWFEAAGDAIPDAIKDADDLGGGIFSVTIAGKKLDGVFKKHEDGGEHHKDEKTKDGDKDAKKKL